MTFPQEEYYCFWDENLEAAKLVRKRQRDYQYDILSDAEAKSGLFKLDDNLGSLQNVGKYINEITNSKWFLKKFGKIGISIDPRVLDKDHPSIAIATPAHNWLYFSKDGMVEIVILHELSHLVNKRSECYYRHLQCIGRTRPKYRGESGHGRSFAKFYLALVSEFMGRVKGTMLKEAFRECGVKF